MESVYDVKINNWCKFGECSTNSYCKMDLTFLSNRTDAHTDGQTAHYRAPSGALMNKKMDRGTDKQMDVRTIKVLLNLSNIEGINIEGIEIVSLGRLHIG